MTEIRNYNDAHGFDFHEYCIYKRNLLSFDDMFLEVLKDPNITYIQYLFIATEKLYE